METSQPTYPQASNNEATYLTILAVIHWVLAALTAMGGLVPLIYMLVGLGLIGAGFVENDLWPIGTIIGGFTTIVGVVLMLFCLKSTIYLGLMAWCLQTRTWHTFCLVGAAYNCIYFPMGTILGGLTLAVLLQDNTRRMFGVA